MTYGLSDRDRERLEQGRIDAAIKMAAERRRLDEQEALAAKAREREARLGPVEVTGPDGLTAQLWVAPSGMVGFDPTSGVSVDGDGCLVLIPLAIVMFVVGWISHKLIFRSGHTLHVKIPGRRKIKYRERSESTAAERLQLLSAAIRRDGGKTAIPPA